MERNLTDMLFFVPTNHTICRKIEGDSLSKITNDKRLFIPVLYVEIPKINRQKRYQWSKRANQWNYPFPELNTLFNNISGKQVFDAWIKPF